ncbi:hypothetical protein AVHY2522_20565 [Acidovorax sp. SUPP2522]|uniref:hypothetical protein n=1 Tax=unclassified Acidovorax TaxID=2684926 RepID=UPI0023494A06|nr:MULTISPECIES: hypothetical protein [unclassified Acidovorax]WCM97590.1 hypothetical protein M5C96_24945 [Acidovorax sp. GBBC 1281]GKT18911.1 hypothetical protein AVHY2522_20565 [Acidovorax sp. SUPP2522]
MTVRKHTDFFDLLDQNASQTWDAKFLLKTFGTGMLRKFELPVRWMAQERGVFLSEVAKGESAALRSAAGLLDRAPAGSKAHELLAEFGSELRARLGAGQIKANSLRMALRPAVQLLERSEPPWQAIPDQRTLERLLTDIPGQRAAASTFLGFLKKRYQVELSTSQAVAAALTARGRELGNDLAALARVKERDEGFPRQWGVTALQFLHRLKPTQAHALWAAGSRVEHIDGYEVVRDGKRYWVPNPPKTIPKCI